MASEKDPVDQAVAAAEAPSFQMTQVQQMLPSGRPIIIALPVDVTELEALQGVGAYLMAVDQIRVQALRNKPRILVPAGVHRP